MAEATRKSTIIAPEQVPMNTRSAGKPALRFDRFLSKATVSPYDEVQWERRTALISDASGKTIFEQKDVEVPVDWSMTATNIVASKYLHGPLGHAAARDRSAATDCSRGGDGSGLGAGRRILRDSGGCRDLPR